MNSELKENLDIYVRKYIAACCAALGGLGTPAVEVVIYNAKATVSDMKGTLFVQTDWCWRYG